MKDDVRAYVEGLIKREFSANRKEQKVFLNKRKASLGEHRNVQRRPILQSSVVEENLQT